MFRGTITSYSHFYQTGRVKLDAHCHEVLSFEHWHIDYRFLNPYVGCKVTVVLDCTGGLFRLLQPFEDYVLQESYD